ncbi:hypothetical protein ACFL9U_00635 [Thermodesulfobacteriota bacterium]
MTEFLTVAAKHYRMAEHSPPRFDLSSPTSFGAEFFKRSTASKVLLVIFLFIFLGCASKRPVLYPNDHLKQVGNAVAEADINECIRLAEQDGAKSDKGETIAKNTAGAAAIGAAAGAAWGAFYGDAGRRAGAGAAAGAAGSLVHGAIRSGDPDAIHRQYVDRCLREKGYETIGWK